jgi:RimJ/RimL family protein N-acetyltransferase
MAEGEQAMLRGERVVLRPIQRADLPRLWELLEDLEVKVRRETGPVVPISLARYEARFDQEAATPASDQLWFAVESDGELIGEGGLYGIDHFNRRCELGIGLGRGFWGKGLGQDAVRTVVDYAFTHLNMNRVALEVLADDARAVGAYRKVGFVEEGRLRQQAWVRGRFEDDLLMAVLREGWESRGRGGFGGQEP